MLIASKVLPRYSMTWPVPPAVPMLADDRQDQILGRHAEAELAVDPDFHRLGRLRACRVCVARTCSTSLVPMPNASAPSAPCAAVWLSPQTTVVPGKREALLRPDDVDDALARRRSRRCRARRTRRHWPRARPVARRSPDRRSAGGPPLASRRAVSSADYGRGRPASGRAAAPCGRPGAGLRRPAARSPRGRGAGRCRSGRCRRRAARRHARPRSSRRGCAVGHSSAAARDSWLNQFAVGVAPRRGMLADCRARARRIRSRSRFRRDLRCGSPRSASHRAPPRECGRCPRGQARRAS